MRKKKSFTIVERATIHFVIAIILAVSMNFTNQIVIHGLNDDRTVDEKELVQE